MLILRSLIFNVVFYVNLIAMMLGGAVFYITPRRWSMAALKFWASTSLLLLRVLTGTKVEVRGREHLKPGAILVAGKHQSLWETFALLPLFDDPAMVLKKELTRIPLFGWFALKFKMIAVDRGAGASALKGMIRSALEARDDGRQILIFPEGTRRAPDAEPLYRPGADALYLQLDVPCIPFALNSGLYWPRRRFIRRPGTIVVEFLPEIPPGLPRKEFSARLQSAIEPATARLVAEGRQAMCQQ